jgi:hypothetical protein
MRSNVLKSSLLRLLAVLSVATIVALVLGACSAPKPVVTKTVSTDEKGRRVSHYRICETSGLPYMKETACRTETVVHNYCYQSRGVLIAIKTPFRGAAR